MIIKKFQAKTESEAIEIAKKELGPSVVIMNVRNMKKKGFFHLFRKKMTEITVALEDDDRSAQKSAAKENTTGSFDQRIPAADPMAANAQGNTSVPPAGKSPLGELIPEELVRKTEAAILKEEPAEKAIEEKLETLQTLLEQKLQNDKEAPEEKAEEVKEKKEPEEKPVSKASAFRNLLYSTMLDNEVDEKYAKEIIEEIQKSEVKPNVTMDYLLSDVYQKMILRFGKAFTIKPAAKGPKVVFFIGPTGVGKTTTIAKIASHFCVEENQKCALLTADTYRIAAAEQLRTYANILEVPFRVIYTVEEIEIALRDYADYAYILVDTAGHSLHNESQRNNMSEFVHAVDGKAEKEVYLVLSATTKYRDLIQIVDTYKKMTDYKLIFTKLDETEALGNLYNIKLHTGVPLSYITCGQNVPDDIEVFNPQRTVKQLLGGKR